MIRLQEHHGISAAFFEGLLFASVFLVLALAGCKTGAHTSDPRLHQIDEMLDAQLPQGTPRARVIFYLSSQNFTVENPGDAKAVVAIVHRVDTNTLQPVTARVTFQFDASDKLKSYDLEAATGPAPQP
jgi:hypothetical protein